MIGETLLLALSSIAENRLRAFLTTLGIVFGVMAVIAVVSIVQGVFSVYTSQLERLGAGFMFAVSGNPQATEKTRQSSTITADDAKQVEADVADVLAVSPYFFDRRTLQHRGQTAEAVIMPTSERYPEIQEHWVDEGRFFTALELRNRARVVVLGPELAQKLGIKRAVGESVRLYGVPFTVIGVMEQKKGVNVLGQPFDQAAVIPHATALQFSSPMRGGMLLIRLRPLKGDRIDDVERARQEVRRALRKSHRLGAGEPDDFQLVTQSEILESVASITNVATWVVIAIVGVALLVGGIGIMNIMLVSVTERTREIGVRMALGARRRHVMAQFLVEAALLGLIGGLIGIALGWGVSGLVTLFVPGFPPPFVPLWAVTLAFVFSASIGLIFGIYPAARAARLDPIEALRFE
jgi:putative ABC transport system permease protein